MRICIFAISSWWLYAGDLRVCRVPLTGSLTRVQPPPFTPRAMYAVTADTKNEDLLANACETLASAKTIAQEFAGLVKPSQRRTLMGIAQLIMLGELAVNRVLDNLELPG
nr:MULTISPECIES: DUF6124 family protein [Pseudomonas]TSB50071.1 hypothetical protein FEE99_22245 [Pseudomonas sp. ef1]